MIYADTCRLEDNHIYQPPDELESLLLSFYFNPADFLTSIYDLHSFDQVIYWTLENNHLPFNTIKRVHNCAWKVYGSRMEEISSGVIDYYYDIAKLHWLKDYAKIIQNKYSFNFVTKQNFNNINNTQEEIYEILATKYFDYNFFQQTSKNMFMNIKTNGILLILTMET